MLLNNTRLHRFKSLFLSLLLLFVLIAILLSSNYYANLQLERNANILDGAGEMSDQFYNLALEVQELSITPVKQRSDLVEQTLETREEISTLLDLLVNGGRYDYGDGDYIDISALKSIEGRAALKNVQNMWQEYDAKLQDIVSSDVVYQQDAISQQRLTDLGHYVFLQQPNIYEAIDEIYADRFEDSQFWSKVSKFILIGGIALISLFFLWFFLYFIRRLNKSEEYLEKAREQNQEILSTINEGLFLIDKDLIIAEQYSNKLEEIVQQKDLAGKSLLELISPLVSDEDLKVAKSFINQLYSSWVVEDLIEELNPLKDIKVLVTLDDNHIETRYLDFRFSRVIEDDEIIRILVTVADITESMELSERLTSERQQNDRQIEMISNLIDIHGPLLKEFVETTRERINSINDGLKTPGSDPAQMMQKAHHTYRQVHSIKGEASALKLMPFVDLTQNFEGRVADVLKRADQQDLSGNDFLPLTVMLNELIELLDFVDSLAMRLQLYHTAGLTLADPISANTREDSESSPSNDASQALINPAINQIEDVVEDGLDEVVSNEITEEIISFPEDDSEATSSTITPNTATLTTVELTTKWQQFAQAIAERHHKSVRLQVVGLHQFGLPNQLARPVNDILIQLIRNAIVHGIEPPSIRHQMLKPETGSIKVEFEHLASQQLKIVIEDDGEGLNFDKIKQKAIEKGLVNETDVLSKPELVNLMFVQGVSTAEGVSEDAGRGVGMDIVKALVEELGGKLSLNTKPKQSTSFTILLPLSSY